MGLMLLMATLILLLALGSITITITRNGSLLLNKNIVFVGTVGVMALLCSVVFTVLPSNYIYHKLFSVVSMVAGVVGAYVCRKERRVKPMQICLGLALSVNVLLCFI